MEEVVVVATIVLVVVVRLLGILETLNATANHIHQKLKALLLGKLPVNIEQKVTQNHWHSISAIQLSIRWARLLDQEQGRKRVITLVLLQGNTFVKASMD